MKLNAKDSCDINLTFRQLELGTFFRFKTALPKSILIKTNTETCYRINDDHPHSREHTNTNQNAPVIILDICSIDYTDKKP